MRFKKDVGAVLSKSGVSFRVWAPFAQSVSVTGTFNNWSETAMDSENDGYWHTLVKGAESGQEYKFIVRNGDKTLYRNDPRALHFTTSAGNSVIVDPAFDWGNSEFSVPPVEQQVIYELHVGTFNRPDPSTNGTFQDVISKLDHLSSLGINMIELMPIGSMLMDRGWGYAVDYIFAVESLYGGRQGFLQFVKAAHNRGIGVILDLVFNHFGPDNSLDLWQFDGWQQDNMGGIYFYNDWRAKTPWGNTRPDFGRPEVRQYILDSIKMWLLDCRVDGLRLDSTIFIRNVEGYNNDSQHDIPEGWLLLQETNDLAEKIKPGTITVAEDMGGNEYIVKPVHEGGAGFDAQWELGYRESLKQALGAYDPDINLTGFTSQLNRRYNGNPFQRIIFMDSHDTAANGSARWNEIIAPGKASGTIARKKSLVGAALLLTTPGIPMLFQGQEFMEGGSFNDWQGLEWKKAERYKEIILAYQHLIFLRRNLTGVSAGLQGSGVNLIHLNENDKVLAYHRWKNGGPKDDTVVVVNFKNKAYESYGLPFPRNGLWRTRFNSTWKGYSSDFKDIVVPDALVTNGEGTIVLPPQSAIIFSQDD